MRTRSFLFFSLILPAFLSGLLITQAYAQDDAKGSYISKTKSPASYGVVLMDKNTRDSKTTKPVLFPHWAHRTKYTCSVCHDADYPMANTTDIKHIDLDGGKYCAKCHNGAASFGLKECERCHSYGTAAGLTGFDAATNGLPGDDFGNKVNWAAAVRDGKIKPEASIDGKAKLTVLDKNIIIPAIKMTPHPPDVLFPHKAHTEQLDCSNCHTAIFKQKAGDNPDMNMMRIISGQYCGVCHGRVSFPLNDCFRCHSQPPQKLVPEPAKDKKETK